MLPVPIDTGHTLDQRTCVQECSSMAPRNTGVNDWLAAIGVHSFAEAAGHASRAAVRRRRRRPLRPPRRRGVVICHRPACMHPFGPAPRTLHRRCRPAFPSAQRRPACPRTDRHGPSEHVERAHLRPGSTDCYTHTHTWHVHVDVRSWPCSSRPPARDDARAPMEMSVACTGHKPVAKCRMLSLSRSLLCVRVEWNSGRWLSRGIGSISARSMAFGSAM